MSYGVEEKPGMNASPGNVVRARTQPHWAWKWPWALVIFCTVLLFHGISPIRQSSDSRWTIPTAMSIIAEGNTNLDEYEDLIEQHRHYNILSIDGHKYARYSIGVPLVAVPFVAARDVYYRLAFGHGFQKKIEKHLPSGYERFIASFLVALTSVLIYLTALRCLGSVTGSLVIVFVFAFCTSAWSTASRGLWQHGPTMLVMSATLHLILLSRKRPRLLQFTGLLLGFSYVIRPTNALPAAIFALFILICHRRRFLPFLGWMVLVLIPFFAYNYSVYGALLSEYYRVGSHYGSGTFLEALAGHLVSPSRGLFVFSPVLLFAIPGVFLKLKEKGMRALDVTLLLAVLLHLAMISLGVRWWAGHSFGPRYVSDVTPFFVWFLIPVVAKFCKPMTWTKMTSGAVFVVLAAASFFVNYQGATNGGCLRWNTQPQDVDEHPERVWDWSDPQFLRPHKKRTPRPNPENLSGRFSLSGLSQSQVPVAEQAETTASK